MKQGFEMLLQKCQRLVSGQHVSSFDLLTALVMQAARSHATIAAAVEFVQTYNKPILVSNLDSM